LEDISDLCIRRFKKDIIDSIPGSFLERIVNIEECTASPIEEEAFKVFSQMSLKDNYRQTNSNMLFKTTLEKAMFSSPVACIQSIDERLKKLNVAVARNCPTYVTASADDVCKLTELKEALIKITPDKFSRYQKLLTLLKDPDYGWTAKKDDRIVIFTERIKTMDFLVENLIKDLKMNEESIRKISGEMSDKDQQEIVELFGRDESPIRILVASDVASEGINLHYLSHRLIHFDIPWSLMVFQQRNGRIDRYGQTKRPDIRYFMINSENEKIKGDVRIVEILIKKEINAYKNIGDPTLLMCKFNVTDEEDFTAKAIESGVSPEIFSKSIDDTATEFDPFEELMSGSTKMMTPLNYIPETTLFSDIDYVTALLSRDVVCNIQNQSNVTKLQTVHGIEISITPDLRKRLEALLPAEVVPTSDHLRLSPDKDFCMSEMKRSLQNPLSETAWPTTQYLWKLHPIFDWMNDKASLIFGRNEAPIIGLSDHFEKKQCFFLVAGTIQNRKSSPVVDEWFVLLFEDGRFQSELTMSEFLSITKLHFAEQPNREIVTQQMQAELKSFVPQVINIANDIMNKEHENYIQKINPQINVELDKLAQLHDKHKAYQLTLFGDEIKKEKERQIDKLFDRYALWVKDTLEIENNPYIRIIATVVRGY
jgi:hypothetical protein